MKVKIIDILVKLANGEIVLPIKYYNRNDMQKMVMLTCKENILYRLNDGSICLNDEVEIIEEPKEIEKIGSWYEVLETESKKTQLEEINHNFNVIFDRLEILIDVVNELKKVSK